MDQEDRDELFEVLLKAFAKESPEVRLKGFTGTLMKEVGIEPDSLIGQIAGPKFATMIVLVLFAAKEDEDWHNMVLEDQAWIKEGKKNEVDWVEAMRNVMKFYPKVVNRG